MNGFRRACQGRTSVRGIIWLLVAALLVSIVVFKLLAHRQELLADRDRLTRLSANVLRLDEFIGYGGFIHDFKNAILRPDEPRYLESASDKIDAALALLPDIAALTGGAVTAADIDAIEATFHQYRSMLAVVKRHAGAMSAREIDAMVRISDEPALARLRVLLYDTRVGLTAQMAAEQRAAWLTGFLLVAMFLSAITHAIYRRFSEKAAVAREAMEQAIQRKQDVERVNEELTAFAYAASHDLKAPAITSRLALQTMLDDTSIGLTPAARELATMARDTLSRMLDHMGELLRYTSVVGPQCDVTRVDLNEVFARVLANTGESIERTGAVVTADPLPVVHGIAWQLESLLQNLVCNAIRYRREGIAPCIHVGYSGDDTIVDRESQAKRFWLRVHDNGLGIEPRYAEQIFTLFKRLHSDDEIPGTGLGLALCKRVALNHGGDVVLLRSTPGEGSVFAVSLLDQPGD